MTTSALLRPVLTALLVAIASPVSGQSTNLAPVESRQSRGFPPLQGPGSQIGASVRDLTASESRLSSGDSWFTAQAGVVIEQIGSWTPSSRAGLMKGDIVNKFDGYPVRNVAHFSRLVGETPPGRTVKITIVRGGKVQELSIIPIL